MKVLLAETAGFCKGVRRAMNMVLERSEHDSRGIYTDGPLIHNPQTIEMLERRGVRVLSRGDAPGQGDTVVIRSHGVPPERREQLNALGVSLCDATCPDVARIQGLIRRHVRQGFEAIIVGDKNHAEVLGLEGYAEGHGHVVSGAEEVEGLPAADKVCVVAQSTLYPETFTAVTARVRQRWPEAVILDTICPSTYHRQEELQRLALTAEAVVVVGGKNSANTQRLAQISAGLGTPTFHVETAEELDSEHLKRYRSVAVTAGASTPNWIIMQAVEKLRGIEHEASPPVWRFIRHSARLALKTDLFIAAGAALLCYANARLMGLHLGWVPYAVAFCYIMCVHLLTHFTNRGAFERSLDRAPGVQRTQDRFYIALAVSAALAGLVFASFKGWLTLLIMLGLVVMAALYRLDILPPVLTLAGRRIPLRLVPASKDLNMSLGWSTVTVFFPLWMTGHTVLTPTFFLAFGYTFLIVLSRSLFFDLRDMQGDRIVGRETLPIIIGRRWTLNLQAGLLLCQSGLLISGTALGWLQPFGWMMLLVTGYICLYLYLFQRGIIRQAVAVEVAGDSQFLLAGALAFLHSFL
ncbi:4-hydroxy-3-methylbut-2-enyl diphosphate reductase [bacterium]|nr:4-hydroxy-3-methylbut-2-enyl diphosphate reductase [bacterium]